MSGGVAVELVMPDDLARFRLPAAPTWREFAEFLYGGKI